VAKLPGYRLPLILNSIDQVEDREMAGSNKRQIQITGSFYRQLGFLDSSVS
jgi:hypothetical protein